MSLHSEADFAPGRMISDVRGSISRRLIIVIVAAAVVITLAFVSMFVGSSSVSPRVVIEAILNLGDAPQVTVMRTQRLPRTVLGLAVGLALGASGALMQGHTRNPLAEPGLFGVNAGASLGVALCTFTFQVSSPVVPVIAALLGALGASAAVVAVAWSGAGRGSPATLALVGSATAATLGAVTTALVLLDRQSLETLRYWAVGSLSGRQTELMPLLLTLIGVGLVLAWLNGPGVTALGLGIDVARALGNRVGRIRLQGIVAITLLAAAATAACGPITFVGLAAPTIMRRWIGPHYGWLIPASALAAAALVLGADVLGRVILPMAEVPVGFVMALLAAPMLVWVLSGRRAVAP